MSTLVIPVTRISAIDFWLLNVTVTGKKSDGVPPAENTGRGGGGIVRQSGELKADPRRGRGGGGSDNGDGQCPRL